MSKATKVCDEPESLFVLTEAVLRFLLFLAELSAVKKDAIKMLSLHNDNTGKPI